MFLPVLAHHNKGSLNSGYAGKNQIQENEWKRIKSTAYKDNIYCNPAEQNQKESADKKPASYEFCDSIGCILTERVLFLSCVCRLGYQLVKHKMHDIFVEKFRIYILNNNIYNFCFGVRIHNYFNSVSYCVCPQIFAIFCRI